MQRCWFRADLSSQSARRVSDRRLNTAQASVRKTGPVLPEHVQAAASKHDKPGAGVGVQELPHE